jgi:hypothetical protein
LLRHKNKYLWFRFLTDPIFFCRPYYFLCDPIFSRWLQAAHTACQNGVCCQTNYWTKLPKFVHRKYASLVNIDVGTLLQIAQQKTTKTMKIFKKIIYFRPTDPNFFTIWNRNHRYFFLCLSRLHVTVLGKSCVMWNCLLKVLNNIILSKPCTNTRWVDDPITNSTKSIYTSHTFKATNTTWVDDFMPIVAEPCFTASMAYSIWWIRPCSNAIRCITKKM